MIVRPLAIDEDTCPDQLIAAWTSHGHDKAIVDLVRNALHQTGKRGHVITGDEMEPCLEQADAVLIGARQSSSWVDDSIPFSEAIVPRINRHVRQEFSANGDGAESMLHSLTRTLAKETASLIGPSMLDALAIQRAMSGDSIYSIFAENESSHYVRFIEDMGNQGLSLLLDETPVLKRILGARILQFTTSTRKMLSRLAADSDEISGLLGLRVVPSGVTAIEPLSSETHTGGERVTLVRFGEKHAVVYKPRDSNISTAWKDLLCWINAESPSLRLTTPRTIKREGYCWQQFIEHGQEVDPSGATEFFTRAGALLCILTLFEATDMHAENIVAHGDCPVIIDLETILSPRLSDSLAGEFGFGAPAAPTDTIDRVILRTAFLKADMPFFDQTVDVSGIGGRDMAALSTRVVFPRSDRVTIEGIVDKKQAKNGVYVGGERLCPSLFVNEIKNGFALAFHAFVCSRDSSALLKVLDGFANCMLRVTVRSTLFYGVLLARIISRDSIYNVSTWNSHLATVFRGPKSEWGVALALREFRALKRFEVPIFFCQSDSVTVLDETLDKVGDVIEESAYRRMRTRLRTLTGSQLSDYLAAVDNIMKAR